MEQQGIVGNCCDPWLVTAVISAPFVTQVTYTQDVASPVCDCVCGWSFAYEVSPLDPGTWEIQAGAHQAQVVIP